MVKTRTLIISLIIAVIVSLVVGGFVGNMVFGNRYTFVPPNYRFITNSNTCDRDYQISFTRSDGQRIIDNLDDCIIEKVESNGNLRCVCSE